MSRDINNKFWDEELETLPREELEKRQLADLQEIVKFAYDNAPYYKRSFDEAGVKPEDIKTLKDIQKFPFINKTTQRDTQGVGSFLGELAAVPEVTPQPYELVVRQRDNFVPADDLPPCVFPVYPPHLDEKRVQVAQAFGRKFPVVL